MKINPFYNRINASYRFFGSMSLIIMFVSNMAMAQCDLACNEVVNLSLNGMCTFTVTPDYLLEGFDPDECMGEVLSVVITDVDGYPLIGNVVTAEHRGQTLKASVVSSSGNSCWGNILVEDKLAAILICDTVYTTCTGSLIPGDSVSRNVSFAAEIEDGSLMMGVEEDFEIKVFGIDSATILDVDFLIDIETDDLSSLEVKLESPEGTMVTLITSGDLSNMCNDGIMVTLDDEAMMTYADLQSACDPGEEKLGRFQVNGKLIPYYSEEPKGTWTVSVTGNGNSEIKKLVLVLEQEGALVRFPGRGNVVGIQESSNTFTLTGIDPCGDITATFKDNIMDQDCDSDFDKIIEREWRAIDEYGNISEPCTQLIYVYRNGLSTLVLPLNFDGIQNPVLSCVDFADKVPDISVTGYPSGDFCDNVQIFPIVDKRIEVCPGSYKLLREFTILEWCSGELINYTQLIKVADTTGPEIIGLEDVTISALPFDCIGEYKVPKPEVFDACSDSFDYKISYQYADLKGDFDPEGRPFSEIYTKVVNGQHIVTDLPIGKTLLKWTITDECGQTTDSIFQVTVEDKVPPVAVCDEFTVVGIGSDGIARVPAITFDDLSYDNCEIIKYEARKMVDRCGISTRIFRDNITFCCAEIGTSIMVEFRVVDSSNNSNTCMVEVKVEDKLPPYIKRCPPNIEIECDADFNNLELTGSLIEGVNVFDNCGPLTITYEDDNDLDNCGIGIIYRKWIAEDGVGFKHSCIQEITLIDSHPFGPDNIIIPMDLDTLNCEADFDPKKLDERYRLRVDEEHCSMVAISYKDQPFYIVEDACEKILRKWSIIDWCRYKPNNQNDSKEYETGVFTHLQILKKINDVAPVITNCEDVTIDAYNSDCTGDIDFTLKSTDDCTPRDLLKTYYEVDFDSDGTYTSTINGATINTVWPVGRHKVKWHVEDRCGNFSKCEQEIYVKDSKKPTPYCISSLTTVVMNNNGTIEIWARDYDFGSFDNCTPQEELWFTFDQEYPVLSKIGDPHYFKGDGIEATHDQYLAGDAQRWIPKDRTSGIILDCDDIPNGKENKIGLNMTVWDEVFNSDFCTIELILQDNAGDACPDVDIAEMVNVVGTVTTPNHDYMGAIDVYLTSDEENRVTRTDSDGNYAFTNLQALQDYLITAESDNDPINGVNTLDLVKIQRHLLGIKAFDSPLQILASDADNNNRVTAGDIIVIRKLILGVYDEFSQGQKSWRFINGGLNISLDDPFPIEDGIKINDINENRDHQNLMGIKIGDVDGDATINARNSEIKTRSEKELVLTIPDRKASYGEEVNIPVSLGQSADLLGMQFSLDYDPAYLRFLGVQSGALTVNDENVGLRYEQDGIVTISWNDVSVVDLLEGSLLFDLQFEALENNSLDLNINSIITDAVAYSGNEEKMELILERISEVGEISLQQNNPNPFSNTTRIDFTLPEAMQISMDINDASGKLLKKISGFYNKGRNSIELSANEIDARGVLYYTLRAGTNVITKKMIKF
jgi:subtilisin-like proprotein convertase family protein